jgi:SAM-dependent methyltransferase
MIEEKRITISRQTGRAHKYKPTSLELIQRVGFDAKILDVGGGDRKLDLPNFINLDIIRSSRLVTLIADAHFLPFKDDVFDLVLCEAAIEHFRYPWVAVEQLYRVLKNGGFVYADVAFLQPVHSYPNHYFNMTLEGVRVLFEKFKLVDSGMQDYQMPSYTLQFILSRYIRCLFPRIDKKAQNIEVYDSGKYFLETGTTQSIIVSLFNFSGKILRAFDKKLSREKAKEIAAGFYLTGQKE